MSVINRNEDQETYLTELILIGLLMVTPDALAQSVTGPSGGSNGLMGHHAVELHREPVPASWAKVHADHGAVLLSQGDDWNVSIDVGRESLDGEQWNLNVYLTASWD
jgi:hypothetical protein